MSGMLFSFSKIFLEVRPRGRSEKIETATDVHIERRRFILKLLKIYDSPDIVIGQSASGLPPADELDGS
jgi:hypothetical protein